MSIEINVPSSSSDSVYLVTISSDEEGIIVSCSCPAGMYGKLCRHKLQVLTECLDDELATSPNAERVPVRDMLKSTDILALLRGFSAAERDLAKAKRVSEMAKRNLEMALKGEKGKH